MSIAASVRKGHKARSRARGMNIDLEGMVGALLASGYSASVGRRKRP